MDDRIRVGIIGCGGISRGHIKHFLDIPDAEIAALVEPNPAALDALRKDFPQLAETPSFADFREMLEKVRPDAVQINSPHNVHFEQITASLDAGCHVLTEKPMVCKTIHALEVIRKAEESGLIVGISYQRHAAAVYQYVRKNILDGSIGEVQYVTSFQGQDWLKNTRGTWRQIKEISCGGQLNDSGSHLIDIVLWLTGLVPTEVSASCRNFDSEVDINSSVSVLFENGAQGTFSIVGNYPGAFTEATRIVGETGVFTIFGSEEPVIYQARGETHRIENLRGFGAPSCDHNFISAIKGEAEILAPPSCGLNVIRLTEAAWESAVQGRPVKVSELET